MKSVLEIIAVIAFLALCAFISYTVINAIINSDMPLWLKIMLSRR